jgi:hypothetical protein
MSNPKPGGGPVGAPGGSKSRNSAARPVPRSSVVIAVTVNPSPSDSQGGRVAAVPVRVGVELTLELVCPIGRQVAQPRVEVDDPRIVVGLPELDVTEAVPARRRITSRLNCGVSGPQGGPGPRGRRPQVERRGRRSSPSRAQLRSTGFSSSSFLLSSLTSHPLTRPSRPAAGRLRQPQRGEDPPPPLRPLPARRPPTGSHLLPTSRGTAARVPPRPALDAPSAATSSITARIRSACIAPRLSLRAWTSLETGLGCA